MFSAHTREITKLSSSAESLFSDAEFCLRTRRIAEAVALYSKAELAGYNADQCSGARWICFMLGGNFEAAWRESVAIENRGGEDVNRFWLGKPLNDQKILIRCLHGLGDTIQFIRYAPLLRSTSQSVVVEAQPSLKRLIEASGLADQVITWGDPEPAWDQQIEVLELPRIFQTVLSSIPNRVPYITVAPTVEVSTRSSANLGGTLRVGLVWSSSSYNPTRSIPFNSLARICSAPFVQFFSFQAGPERHDLQSFPSPIKDLYDESGCILSAARRLQTMDLVITVDTMLAHLAGALALPVWTLLPFEADWRWMLDRSDSPWYPSMRLFRQPRPGDWDSVIDTIAAELKLFPLEVGCRTRQSEEK